GAAGGPEAARGAPTGLVAVGGGRFGAGEVAVWPGETAKPPGRRTPAGRGTGHRPKGTNEPRESGATRREAFEKAGQKREWDQRYASGHLTTVIYTVGKS